MTRQFNFRPDSDSLIQDIKIAFARAPKKVLPGKGSLQNFVSHLLRAGLVNWKQERKNG